MKELDKVISNLLLVSLNILVVGWIIVEIFRTDGLTKYKNEDNDDVDFP